MPGADPHPGDIVIADNPGSHKGAPAGQLIRDAGAHLLCLPPYSPDLNPIGMVFAKLEALFRKTGERSLEASWRKIGSLLDTFTTTDARTTCVTQDTLQIKSHML